MKGTYYKRGNKYRFQYMFKGQRYSTTVECKDRDVENQLALWVNDIEKGTYYNTDYTFYEFSQIWLKETIIPNCTPAVTSKYISYLNNRILPVLGKYKLTDINPIILNNYFNELKKSQTMYANRENKPISKGTFLKVREIINTILKTAYKFELIPSNPMEKVTFNLDGLDKRKIECYDRETYNTVLALLKNEKIQYRVVIEIALKMGLRRSEIWALTWNDIDFKNATITINKSKHYTKGVGVQVRHTKTPSSVRTIAIPSSLLELLIQYREIHENSELFDNISIDGITTWFAKFQKKHNIQPHIRFHDLRHTHATLLLTQQADIKSISERLGHSNISITMNTYTHFSKELDQILAQKIDSL